MKKGKIGVLLGLFLLLFCIFSLERDHRFFLSKQIVHSQSVPPKFLAYGTLGKVMKQMNVVRAVPRDYSLFPSSQESPDSSWLFPRKQSPLAEQFQFRSNPGGMLDIPSSLVISESDFKDGWPLLSLVLDEKELYDPERGIFSHKQERGQNWERLAYLSYFKDRRLRFASGVGVRIHGGSASRKRRNRDPAFRLYFRNVYGVNQVEPGIFYNSLSNPMKHLVIVPDWPRYAPFLNSVAFDISRQIGAMVPESQPILFFLNGEFQGAYSLLEHLHKRQWEYHLGHDDFVFYRYRGKSDEISIKLHSRLDEWAKNYRKKMTLNEAEKRVDLDNLSRQIISFVFCGTSDWRQGAAVSDLGKPGPRYFWISWDMNHSIIDMRAASHYLDRPRPSWEQEGFELILAGKLWYIGRNPRVRVPKNRHVRSVLFSRLIDDSPQYREYFVRLVMDLLNHRLTPVFFQSMLEKYRQMAISYGFRGNQYTRIERFLEHRPNFLRKQIQQFFHEGECYPLKMIGPRGILYEIDGYPEKAGYKGMYFEGKKIKVKILKSPKRTFSHWEVNGKRVDTKSIEHAVRTRTNIKPVFR